jgi:uncharacterized Ntn-hydrolase superfamily protein
MDITLLVAALNPLVANRVYPDVVPQAVLTSTDRRPYIRYFEVGTVPDNTIDGVSDTESDETRVQIDVYAATKSEALSVAASVRATITGFLTPPATIELMASAYESEDKLYRQTIDAVFHDSNA